MPTTLLVLSAAPADRAAPRKPAFQRIAKSASPRAAVPSTNTERPETGPWPGTGQRPPERLAPPPAWAASLGSPEHIFENRAQFCTNGRSPVRKTARNPPFLAPRQRPAASGRTGSPFFPAAPPNYSCSFVFIRGPMFWGIRAQSCTNEKPPSAPDLRVTKTNYNHLDESGFESQNRAQPIRPVRRIRLAAPGRAGSSFLRAQ